MLHCLSNLKGGTELVDDTCTSGAVRRIIVHATSEPCYTPPSALLKWVTMEMLVHTSCRPFIFADADPEGF